MRYAPLLAVAVVWLALRALVLGGSTLYMPEHGAGGFAAWLFGFGRNGAWSGLLTVMPLWTHHLVTTLPKEAPITYPPLGFGFGSIVLLVATTALCTGWWP